MKYRAIYTILISLFFINVNNGLSAEGIGVGLSQSKYLALDTDTCTDNFYLDNSIPDFTFSKQIIIAEGIQSETLFRNFRKQYHQTESDRVYVTYSKAQKKDATKINTYTFLLLNGKLLLEYAELMYPAELYKVEHPDLYKLEFNNKLIDIGMYKAEIQKLLANDEIAFCDIIKIMDDSSSSVYYFENQTLKKIVVNTYTP